MQEIPWVGALVLTGLAGIWDWRTRRIPNVLTVTGAAAGLIVNVAQAGWTGAMHSFLGLFALLLLLLPLVLMRGLGAGDWKLIGSLGSFLGLKMTLAVLVTAIFIAGLMAVVQVTRNKSWRATLGNMKELLAGAWFLGMRAHPTIRLENPALLKVPFGVAAALAAASCYVLRLL